MAPPRIIGAASQPIRQMRMPVMGSAASWKPTSESFPLRCRGQAAEMRPVALIALRLAIDARRESVVAKASLDKSVNAPVPKLLYFAGRIRQYSSVSGDIAASDAGAITFGRHFKMTSIGCPPLCSRVQPTFVRHLNCAFGLLYSNFIISNLVYIKSFSVCVQAQIICAKNLSIIITPYVFYRIT
jgi:hypothetical protein